MVALSGGVDSSTAALLLTSQGYEVIGISLKLYSGIHSSECCGVKGIEDARGVAHKLGIPFYVLNYEREFEEKVIKPFCQEYENGRTPNPCVLCNEEIKFGTLLKKAEELRVDYIATGHYARTEYHSAARRYILRKGRDKEKDQSYFLFSLSQKQLSRILFPLGDYTKSEVRRLAGEFGLKVHNKAASQEVCFINTDYREFLKARIRTDRTERNISGLKPGPIVNTEGETVGEHQGIAFYAIGQRKGIGAHRKPLYVIAVDKDKNTIKVGEDRELYKNELTAQRVNWIKEKLTHPRKVKAKIRYKHPEAEAMITPLNGTKVEVRFTRPQRAITPGQAVVFYEQDMVLGGGWIH